MKLTKTILELVIVVANIVTIISMLYANKSNYKENLKREEQRCKNKFLASFKAFVFTYKFFLIALMISALAIISIDLFSIIDEPLPAPTMVETTPRTCPNPIPEFDEDDVRLDEIDPIFPNTKAVITSKWDPFTQISLNGITFEHGIGFFVPKEKQEEYLLHQNNQQITHSESIEYSLAYQYKTLSFDYGIDDSTFINDEKYPPACIYWIVVQSLSSNELANSDENILFETEKMNYRSVLHSSGEIDVSKAEAIRITVYWRFDVSQSKPFTLNIALVNPILFGSEN